MPRTNTTRKTKNISLVDFSEMMVKTLALTDNPVRRKAAHEFFTQGLDYCRLNNRTSIPVKELVEWVNMYMVKVNVGTLAHPGKPFLSELAWDISAVLHHTNNYHGFTYLHWMLKGMGEWIKAGKPENTAPYLGDEDLKVFYHFD
jgi:hypothetical protein